MDIRFEKASVLKQKPDPDKLGFGKLFTDYMFRMEYNEGEGWHDPAIVPYGPFMIEPSAMVFHYSQCTFEGLKAYRSSDGRVLLFRPQKNIERMNNSNDRLCIPRIPEADFMQALTELVKLEQAWIPEKEGTSLYIRPFVIAMDPVLGVHPATHYSFFIILSPVGAYYPEGVNPVKIYVEDEYVRAVKGGLGFAKTGGNYAASIKSQEKAQELGFTQVLWLDGVHRRNIEEVGTMNVFFKIDGKIVTPKLEGSILPGVTRNSCIELCKSWGYEVQERTLPIDELVEAFDSGKLEEAFGTGTAAVISPIGEISFEGKDMTINGFKTGPVAQKLYDTLYSIQTGKIQGPEGWSVEVK